MSSTKAKPVSSAPAQDKSSLPLPIAIVLTLVLVITIREGAVILCEMFGIASAANIVGLIAMFLLLMAWRFILGLPPWLTQASNTLLVDSGFAFLPVSAGAGLLLFALGDEFWGIVITIIVSTLIPLWAFAQLANRWLNPTKTSPAASKPQDTATPSVSQPSANVRQEES